MKKIYFANDSLRIFYNDSEIRFKIGIWNYNEAILNLNNEDEEFKENIKPILNNLKINTGVDIEDVEKMEISKENKDKILNILDGLTQNSMLIIKENKNLSNEITMSLLGEYKPLLKNSQVLNEKLLFVTDSSYCEKMAKILIDEMNINMDIATKDTFETFRDIDLTTNIDALKTSSDMYKLNEITKAYKGIVACFKKPEIQTLRNINRLSIEKEMPIIVSFIDGPFITMLSTNSPKTGCLECFEQRTLARLEDHVSYNVFSKFKFENSTKEENKGIIPIINILTNLVISEAFLLSNYKTTKFENRVLNIYVPTLEIQVQDLLRVPYCPGCGNVSKAKFRELNVSSRTVVDNILDSLNEEEL